MVIASYQLARHGESMLMEWHALIASTMRTLLAFAPRVPTSTKSATSAESTIQKLLIVCQLVRDLLKSILKHPQLSGLQTLSTRADYIFCGLGNKKPDVRLTPGLNVQIWSSESVAVFYRGSHRKTGARKTDNGWLSHEKDGLGVENAQTISFKHGCL